jgi:hypothetical protein
MVYLQRIEERPTVDHLSPQEITQLGHMFIAYGAEMIVAGQAVRWEGVHEVEVVIAPHISGLSGWLVKTFFFRNEEHYHVGIYFDDDQEAVLPNITWEMARYVVLNVAFYATHNIRYVGPPELVAVTDHL